MKIFVVDVSSDRKVPHYILEVIKVWSPDSDPHYGSELGIRTRLALVQVCAPWPCSYFAIAILLKIKNAACKAELK